MPGTLDDANASEREFDDRLIECSRLATRVAYGVLRQREDAEDVAQEAFARARQKFHQLRDPEKFRAWLVRMTWRLAIDRQRSNKRRTAREQLVYEAPMAPTNEELAIAQQESAALWKAIDQLSEKLRVVIILSAIEGHEVCDVAALLDLPEGTVKSRLFLARKRLQEILR